MSKKSHKWTFMTMLIFGVIGLIASFVLAVEEFHLIKNPNAVLSCSINLVLNCSTVMQSWQASVFGFPNMFIGLIGYPIVITVAVVGLGKATLPRWFWLAANLGYALGAVFSYWLFFNSVYVIEVLCPWCLIVTFSTTILLGTVLHYSLKTNTFGLSESSNNTVQGFLGKDYDKLLIASWIVFLVILVFVKFGSDLFV